MSHRFETVADVFPEKHVTPYMALPASGGEPQWFATMRELVEYVKTVGGPVWMDIGDGSAAERQKLFSLLPQDMQVPASVIATIVEPTAGDTVELQSGVAQYVWGTLTCAPMSRGAKKEMSSANAARGEVDSEHFQEKGDSTSSESDTVFCGFFVCEQVALTFHSAPFLGLSETLWRMTQIVAETASPGARGVAGARPCFTSALLAALVSFTSDGMLPNTTALLHEVDTIDEMVLLIGPGEQDQPDLLRRVALLRRRIAALRAPFYLKERLLQDLLTPSMRASFVCAHTETSTLYRDALDKVVLVGTRLDEMRKVLNQGNLTYFSCVSMRMSQSSALLDYQMSLLGKMATFVLPCNLLMGILGFNQQIPFSADHYDNLNAFWVVLSVMLAWGVFNLGPNIVASWKGCKARSILDHTYLKSL